ncbi:MAG TPA: Fe(2+)-trafficking protein [Candidatus Sulfotelmatobacter sp.]|jgi:Fe-S cluster biosynthesis and repair protein YggX|nr:Fe(2+)-trafficking protein [Candidatus Sulfotelmatobacter sp.]
MAVVTCSRCKRAEEGLPRPPIPGPVGQEILGQVCAACWKEWLGTQVKYINEYRLNPLDERHFAFLVEQARAFLGLAGGGEGADVGTPR